MVATQEAVAGQLPPAAGLVAAPPASPLRAEVSHLCVSHSLHFSFHKMFRAFTTYSTMSYEELKKCPISKKVTWIIIYDLEISFNISVGFS